MTATANDPSSSTSLPDVDVTAAAVDLTFRVLYGIRDEITALNATIEQEMAKSRHIQSPLPHTDDIVRAFRAGIERTARDYEARIASFSIDPTLAAASDVLDAGAVVYFMRELIAAKVPALVDRLCPDAKHGVRMADRQQAERDASARLSRLWQDRDALRVRLNVERHVLRDWRHGAKDWRARCAIESEEHTLQEEMEALRIAQDELRRHV